MGHTKGKKAKVVTEQEVKKLKNHEWGKKAKGTWRGKQTEGVMEKG